MQEAAKSHPHADVAVFLYACRVIVNASNNDLRRAQANTSMTCGGTGHMHARLRKKDWKYMNQLVGAVIAVFAC